MKGKDLISNKIQGFFTSDPVRAGILDENSLTKIQVLDSDYDRYMI